MSTPPTSQIAPALEKRRFDVQRCLGRGGFGEVYLAVMSSAGGVKTEVAVKVLRPDLDIRSQAVQRLRDEGRLLGMIKHPSIVRVFDLVMLDGRVALVTEYVEGIDLTKAFDAAHPLPVSALLEVIGKVADALHVAYNSRSHEDEPLHIVHRDVKPANIRIGVHGEVKLLDFGIARAANIEREAHTQTSNVVGSGFYMAPERFKDDLPVGPPSDVFSLGCTLYEGIRRERFYEKLTMNRQYEYSFDDTKYGRYLNEKLGGITACPEPVLRLLKRMLSFDADSRPTAHEVSRACEELAEELPGGSLRRWCRNRAWPPPPAIVGVLDGRVITESSFSLDTGGFQVEELRGPAVGVDTTERARDFTTVQEDEERGRDGGILPWLVAGGATVLIAAAALIAVVAVGVVVLVLAVPGDGGDGVASADDEAGERAGEGRETTGAAGAEPGTPDAAGAEPGTPDAAGADPGTPDAAGADPGTPDAAGADPGTLPPVPPSPPPAAAVATTPPTAATPRDPSPTTAASTGSPSGAKDGDPFAVPAPPPPVSTPPVTAKGAFSTDGAVPIELRSGGASYGPGPLPPGVYEIWADFGKGFLKTDTATITAGGTTPIRCSRLREHCGAD